MRLLNCGLPLIVAAVLATTGCVTTPPQPVSQPAKVYVSAQGVVNFMGRIVTPEELPRVLRKAGVQPEQEIWIHLDDVQATKPAITRLYVALGKKNFKKLRFMEDRRATSYAVGEEPKAAPKPPAAAAPAK